MTVFIKAQVNSVISTLADFILTIFLVEIINVWYLPANIIGSTVGGFINFFLGRTWVFKKHHKQVSIQMFKYIIVWAGGFLLNNTGLYLITEGWGINYIVSKTLMQIFVAVFYNFLLHKYFVFQ